MAVEWIEPNGKRGLRVKGVALSKAALRIGPDERAAMGDPERVRVGIDVEVQALVIVPSQERGSVKLSCYKGAVAATIGSKSVLGAVKDRLGWQPGEALVCTVRGKTLEIKRTQAKETSKRRGDLLRALG